MGWIIGAQFVLILLLLLALRDQDRRHRLTASATAQAFEERFYRQESAWDQRYRGMEHKLLDRIMAGSLSELKHLEKSGKPRVANPMAAMYKPDMPPSPSSTE